MAVYLGGKRVSMVGGQPIIVEGVDTSDANALASDIASGKTAYVDGVKVYGTHECEEGLDTTSSNPVTASDMASGKEAFVNGVKVIGTLVENNAGQGTQSSNYSISFQSSDQTIYTAIKVPKDEIYRTNSQLSAKIPSSSFGDASLEDVAAGKTFTSTSGLKVTGTATYVSVFTGSSTEPSNSTGADGDIYLVV